MSLYLGTLPIAKSAVSRNIGEIIQSTIPLSDAGLHLLDGGVIQGGGAYDDFVTYVAGLVSNYPDLFTTEASWQSSVSTYGVCGKFVYTSGSPATIRLPKITGFTEGTTNLTALGDLVEAGLPNITGDIASGLFTCKSSASTTSLSDINATGAFAGSAFTARKSSTGDTTTSWFANAHVDFRASRSSSIYGNSDTVQPQSIKVLYYIVVATSTKTQIEVDIDEVMTDLNGKASLTDLNGKADVDLSNMNPTQAVKNTIVGWGLPDYSAGVEITPSTSEQSYTCPKAGFVVFSAGGFNGGYSYLKVNDVVINNVSTTGNSYITNVFASTLVSAGDVCKFKDVYNSTVFGHFFKFFPLKGVN